MHALNELPSPDPDALAHSVALERHIREEIAAAGGWIGFDRYMELALYTPGLGYYSGGSRKFGADGDFVTAPEISPLFGEALAAQVEEVMLQSAPYLVEVGAGTGILAADLLATLHAAGATPLRYDILELSGELRERQRETLNARVPQLVERVHWLDTMPERFEGCVIANEVLDVMPVHCIAWREGSCFERGVGIVEDALGWVERPLSKTLKAAVEKLPTLMPSTGEYRSEFCPASRAWIEEWSRSLVRGALVLVDYGYPSAEYYLPARNGGTLQCYYRHRAHTDFFRWPGLNDITSFVDFTAIAEAGFDAGLDVLGYTTQASFLVNCGVLERLARRGATDSAEYLRASRALQRLIGAHDMGEVFKVLALGRGLTQPLRGFALGDRTHAL